MNSKAVIPLVLAVVLGLVAALLVRNAMHHRATVPAASNLVSVVTAARDISPGTQLAITDLVIAKVPADSQPGQVYSDPATLANRVATTPIVKGQTVIETLLAPAGTGSGIQALIPDGKRAITLEVNEFSAVGGMLVPGCHVDVLGVVRDEKQHAQVSRIILQDLLVTAVGRSITPGATGRDPNGNPLPPANHITLMCTPKEAQTLQLTMMLGRPWLALRNSHDDSSVIDGSSTLADLLGQANDPDEFVKNTDTTPTTTTPVSVFDPPTPAIPTTQPVAVAPSEPPHRVVQVFRAGAESRVVFVLPASSAPHNAIAPLDTSPIGQ